MHHLYLFRTDDYAADDVPEVRTSDIYVDPVRSQLPCFVSYKTKIHRLASDSFTESQSSI